MHLAFGQMKAGTVSLGESGAGRLVVHRRVLIGDEDRRLADLGASYTGPNYFSEAKYFAVDCQEEVPFTDPKHLLIDITTHPEFANFGVDADDWDVCANWVTA